MGCIQSLAKKKIHAVVFNQITGYVEAPKAQSTVVLAAPHICSLKAPHWKRWDPKLQHQHDSKSPEIKHKPSCVVVQKRSAEFGLYVQAQGIGIFPVNMAQELMCLTFVLPELWLGFQILTPGNSPLALLASRIGDCPESSWERGDSFAQPEKRLWHFLSPPLLLEPCY